MSQTAVVRHALFARRRNDGEERHLAEAERATKISLVRKKSAQEGVIDGRDQNFLQQIVRTLTVASPTKRAKRFGHPARFAAAGLALEARRNTEWTKQQRR
jgi:hypothetical protein